MRIFGRETFCGPHHVFRIFCRRDDLSIAAAVLAELP
jgi:hypothetical protein